MWRRLGMSAGEVVSVLAPLLSGSRLAALVGAVAGRSGRVRLVLDGVANPRNVGAALRTAEGVGVHSVDIVAADADAYDHALRSQSASRWLHTRHFADPADALAAPHPPPFAPPPSAPPPLLLAAELSPAARPLDAWRPQICAADSVVLAFGNERHGVSPQVSAAADGAFILPMRGLTQSYNISVAVGMTLATLQAWGVLATGPAPAKPLDELAPAELELLADWCSSAVDHADGVLARHAEPR